MATKKTGKVVTPKTTEKAKETITVKGEELLKKVKEIIKEGNVRKIIIKDKEGKTIIEVPLTLGVVGVVLAPILAAVGAIAALVTECTITVERK
jgi:CBS domain-containing protein